ncbi:MAG: methyltransferase domain-containing protein [Elusimicrobia bacterium]|nr:methyltransferase domain-containing protein [Elusimicrobiota bacterium]
MNPVDYLRGRFGRLLSRMLPRNRAVEAAPEEPPEAERPYPLKRLAISDRDLEEINALLPWHAGTLLRGRLLGRLGVLKGKRMFPDPVPDRRILWLDERLGLKEKSVLEVGCFEGIHTVGLRLFSRDVTAIDIRPVNVVKTLARLSYHGTSARVFQADVESLDSGFGRFDVIFHCGVFYHLAQPVEHLFSLAGMCSHLFLDTHVAAEDRSHETLESRGVRYRGMSQKEGGWADPFSGKSARSFWLRESDLLEALGRAGFARVEFLERRRERHGPRVALLAYRGEPRGDA